jgi:hypothetical protein
MHRFVIGETVTAAERRHQLAALLPMTAMDTGDTAGHALDAAAPALNNADGHYVRHRNAA